MPLKFPIPRKPLRAALFLCLTLVLGISIGYLTNHVFSENAKFEAFAEKIFQKEVSANTLNLHYSVAQPEKWGIKSPEATLGRVSPDTEETLQLCREYEDTLKGFSYSRLSPENQLTLDMLLLHFHTLASLGDNCLLEEYLSPSLGIQAQLPVLLAEYAFYTEKDITDYLKLLSCVRPYFQSILAFEQEKSQAGLFMSDATLDRILAQCRAFIEKPESNYMLEIFTQKLKDFGKFSEEDVAALTARHEELLRSQVIPAYQELIDGLEALRGTGKPSCGLAAFPGGQEYYLYLVQSETGSYTPIRQIEQRLARQLMTDCREMNLMLKEQPSLLTKLTGGTDLPDFSPENALESLQAQMKEDFPALEEVSYEVRQVHASMEDYLSPAFYLTPPVDTQSPNIIYLNNSGHTSNLEQFATLAHEGFPGHLYQTVSFCRQEPSPIRYLINSSGYVEGWATYVESYAYGYAAAHMEDEAAADLTRLAWLNKSVNLCIYCFLDIGIHYRGWNQEKTASFLNSFGITNGDTAAEIYQYIVETPANYLKYYWGYLNFLDLKEAQMQRLGDDFDLKEFHRRILEIGPVQFPVLEKYIKSQTAPEGSESLTVFLSSTATETAA